MTSYAVHRRAWRAEMVTPAQDLSHAMLIASATSGDLETLRRYVQRGGDLDQMDKNGKTALNTAVLYGNIAFAIAALDAGAKPAIRNPFSGNSTLHLAVGHRRREIVKKLLERADAGAFIDLANKDGFTALHWATSSCQPEIVRRLLDAGAVPSAGRDGGLRAAMLDLVNLGVVEGSVLIMEALLEREPDKAGFLTSVAHAGRSLLHAAASAGASAMVKFMLDRGAPADVEAPNQFDARTPFHFACAKGSVSCVRLLAAGGADIRKRTRDGADAMTLALQSLRGAEAAAMLAALMDLGLDPDAPEHEGTPRRLAQRIPEALQVLEANDARRAMTGVLRSRPTVPGSRS